MKIESFIPYFNSDSYVINHHNGLELLALQVGTTPLSVDAAKMLTQTATNACQLALQNRAQSHSSSRSLSRASSTTSARTHSCNSWYGMPQDPFWVNAEDLTPEVTLHNISINLPSMDGPADGAIFESNHLVKIADIRSKFVQNLVKVGKTSPPLHPAPQLYFRGTFKLYTKL